ncbi:efflux transporter outer membrane subunit [Novosphingobium flavum]|uniref:Efflux transporter outer membrane subunit n=1 Tax=Novosphingobium flavum TaxID=1778672 RepID=A0A7X1FSD1_9SPHN|nr:efflux transporter outer membrane subunit [Novosphingobium flavum]MBC2666085.1 efflux transporter outer membrane subunit [Novosphingobium flavum]
MRLRPAVAPLVAAMTSLALAACSSAPAYNPPKIAAPARFKEVAGWTEAAPHDDAPRGDWWSVYQDPALDALEQQALTASPTLAAALARYDQARAAARESEAALYPTVGIEGAAARARVSRNRPLTNGSAVTYDNYVGGGGVDYEIDLWGRVRASVAAGKADAQASQADLASARLSLQAAVADAYFRLRGLDAQASLLASSVDAFGRAYDLTQRRHGGGIASGIDVNRAATVLGNARALVSAIASQRAATEHELAALTGAVASQFALSPAPGDMIVPAIPAATPSQLLERRPDIAAAERRMFAANVRIGVARAAFYPSLNLGAAGGWQSTGAALLSAPSTFWALGPLSAALTLFDGGKRKAQVRLSHAQYEEEAANYRETVLAAFRQVEDAAASIRHLAQQAEAQQDAARAAERTSDIALSRYRDGASDYLEVVTAQTDALTAQRSLISVQTQRMQASIALVKAMGGPA